MQIRWFGQSAFEIRGSKRIVIDPFGAIGATFAELGFEFLYPPVEIASADLLLVTHEHIDHNGTELVGGDPVAIRSTAGTFDSPVGDVVAAASEHDTRAGTERGPNTIFSFSMDGLRFCHLGDFGQAGLRPEQRTEIGDVDVLFVPVGGVATVGAEGAVELVRHLAPRLVVPMHYRTAALNFLEPADAFLKSVEANVAYLGESTVDPMQVLGTRAVPLVAVLAPPAATADME